MGSGQIRADYIKIGQLDRKFTHEKVDTLTATVSDIVDKLNDIMNKCNDIFEKVNE